MMLQPPGVDSSNRVYFLQSLEYYFISYPNFKHLNNFTFCSVWSLQECSWFSMLNMLFWETFKVSKWSLQLYYDQTTHVGFANKDVDFYRQLEKK